MAFKDIETKNAYHRKHYSDRLSVIKRRFGNRCFFCGYTKYPEILEFAHIHGKEKCAPVSTLMRASMKKLEDELKKCILVCPNCHAIYDKNLVVE